MRLKLLSLSFIIILILGTSSCVPQPSFGRLDVCSRIDEETYQPVELQDEYGIDAQKIYATIQVSNVPSADNWLFKWVEPEGGSVLAESTGRYMERDNQYVSGYFASVLIPQEGNEIIAPPGSYRVDYYHNHVLVDSAEFKISEPEPKLLEASLASGINPDGAPLDTRDQFYTGEDIFLCLKLNYLIGGGRILASWFRGQDRFGEATVRIVHDHYQPSYQVMELGESALPPGSYHVDIHINGTLEDSLEFEVGVDLEAREVYEDENYRFSLRYPGWLKFLQESTEDSYHIAFYPQDFEANILLAVWILESAALPEGDRLLFADEVVLKDVETEYGLRLIEKDEGKNFYRYRYRVQGGEEWKLLLDFEDAGGNTYIFLGLADSYYADSMEKIFGGILGSIEFEIEE
ncbi:MAG: hypothetical protein ACQEP5_07070 [Actinomycetota bacterium]